MIIHLDCPPVHIINESEAASICICGSVRKPTFLYGWFGIEPRNKHTCMNPNCFYYIKGLPSEDYNPKYMVYDKDGQLRKTLDF